MNEFVHIVVAELSQVGEVRRKGIALAEGLGFSETAAGQLAIIVSEAATNLVKHARDGEVILRALEVDGTAGIEVLVIDKGPGMDLGRCMVDGFSTAGTHGNGLGAIRRLSSSFDIYSTPAGTALLARLWSKPSFAPKTTDRPDIGIVAIPVAGETVSGDAYAVEQHSGHLLFLMVDGLGHGPLAATASLEAVRIFRDNKHLATTLIVRALDAALKSTRGAALALADVDLMANEVRYVGVGNIAGVVVSPDKIRSMVSHNGIVGHQLQKVQEFVYPFPPDALLIMHSDGLSSNWKLDQYPGLIASDPGLIAGVLYRDFKRVRDDVAVLVARQSGEGS